MAQHLQRGDQRRTHILEAAIAVFLEQGYAGTSVDRIVQRAGGSKATLYRHFNSKADLFAAIIQELVAQMTAPIAGPRVGDTGGLAATLEDFARTYLDVLLEPRSLALYRMVMAEGARFPDLGRVFFDQGPGRVAAQLADYLRQCGLGDAGTSVELLAREFLSLVRSDLHLRALLGVGCADSSQRSEMVERAMATFMNHCLGETPV
ncbi:MAG: TetR/AcrR family transcriptional regulator [Pseudomonadales bacterium]|nr:TetR/AcrR family transcriptional regulator [Pseudomonadales bacterium]